MCVCVCVPVFNAIRVHMDIMYMPVLTYLGIACHATIFFWIRLFDDLIS